VVLAEVSATVSVAAGEPDRTLELSLLTRAGRSTLSAHADRVSGTFGAFVALVVAVVVLTVTDLGPDRQEAHAGLLAGDACEQAELIQVGATGAAQWDSIIDQTVAVVVHAVADLVDRSDEIRTYDLAAATLLDAPGAHAGAAHPRPVITDLSEAEIIVQAVDQRVAIVVDIVTADLGMPGADVRISIITIAFARRMPVTVAVGPR